MPMTPYVGKNTRVQVDAINFKAANWNASEESTDIDSFNTESGGFHEEASGRGRLNFEFEGLWDSAVDPTADPPNLRAGAYVDNVNLYVNVSANRRWNMAQARIRTVVTTVEADGGVRFRVTGTSHGTYSFI